MTNSTSSQSVIRTSFASLLLTVLLLLAGTTSAQTTNTTNGSTPLGLSPGAPAGSYALSGFENVNLYNGTLNFSLPLLQIAGRGGAGYPITLQIEQKWTVDREPPSDGQHPARYSPRAGWWNDEEFEFKRSYSMGHLDMRQGVGKETPGICNSGYVHYSTLTRLTFTAPGGTEYELRDKLTNGQPDNPWLRQCTPINRGKVFVTADGTSATFISETDISDDIHENSSNFLLSGEMMLRDGTRFHINSGLIMWMRDRNGNQLTFTYDSQRRMSSMTDSLNRTVTIIYASGTTTYDQITFSRSGSVSRSIKIHIASLSTDTLRSDFAPRTELSLFPQLNDAAAAYPNLPLIKAIELPNGQQYQLKYDSYGELARVVLPTGGAIEYDYAPGLSDGPESGILSQLGEKHVYRRVIKRRVYPDGGTGAAFATETSYTRPESHYTGTSTTNVGYVRAETLDANGNRLELSDHYFYGSAALSLFQGPTAYPGYKDGREYKTEVFAADGTTVLRRIENSYTQAAVTWWTGNAEAAPPNNPQLTATVTTIEPGGANLVTKETFDYDQFNNQTDVYEYDYGQGAAPGAWVRHSHTDYVTTNNGVDYASPNPTATSIHLRNLPEQQSVYDSNNTEKARTTYEYDIYSGANHATLSARSLISGLDASYTTAYTSRGNVTALTNWLLPSTPLTSFEQYDVAGNVVKTIDARGYATDFYYDDNFGAQNAEARTNTSPQELSITSKQSYAYPTRVSNALGHTSYTQYDYYLGKPVEVEDANGVVSSGYYEDTLDRPTQLIMAANQGATVKSRTLFTYDDIAHVITTAKDRTSFNDPTPLKSQMLYDNMGRTVATKMYEDSTVTNVETHYDVLGRVYQVSNPYRTGDSIYWTTSSYDDLGRVVSVQMPDNAILSTVYSGNQVLVADPAGKRRVSRTNALGQLTDVWEITTADTTTIAVTFPGQTAMAGYLTHYVYDTLGNLLTTTQQVGTNGTVQTRNFTYNSLKRLTSAQNPESGTVVYDYDANGNLWHKTDARNITTTFTYDALNRVLTRSYNDQPQTPTITYSYDTAGIPNAKGELTKVSSSMSVTNYAAFDALGRVTASSQQTNNQTYTMNYEYDLAGKLTREMYPSGRIIEHGYDAAGRINSVTGHKANVVDTLYASQINYAAHGAVARVKLGNSTTGNERWEHTIFNSRLQPVEIGLGSTVSSAELLKLEYKYGVVANGSLDTTQNSGNVQSQIITAPGLPQLIQTYTYDQLSRLTKANEAGGSNPWTQAFIYDDTQNGEQGGRFGNRRIDTSQTTLNIQPLAVNNPTFTLTTNKIADTTNYDYDAAGNLKKQPGYLLSYDAENRISNSTDTSTMWQTDYLYDGDGHRVKKASPSETTVFVYDALGQMVAEYNTQSAASANETSYLTSDALGTPRVITKADGSVKSRHDYFPFGEEITGNLGARNTVPQYSAADGVKQKFTRKERDNETGLDYFGARYYSSSQGRFISPDEFSGGPEEFYEFTDLAAENPTFYADLTDPQSLNKYTYCHNNPLLYIDPDGHQDVRQVARDVFRVAKETVNGAASTVSENNGFGSMDAPQNRVGRAIGHIISLAQGGAEMVGGATAVGLGTGEAVVTSPAATTGVGTVVPAIGVGTAVVGVAVTIHGAGVIANTLTNIFSTNNSSGDGSSGDEPTPKEGSQGGPGAGKAFSKSTKDAARAESGSRCVFCGDKTTRTRGPKQSNIDHAVAKSRGGNNTRANAQNTCRTCNLKKGTRSTQEFLNQQ